MDSPSHIVNLEGRDIPVKIRRNARARRIILRVDNDTGGAIVTLPIRANERDALVLVQEKSDWLLSRIASLSVKIPFQNGVVLPLLGQDHVARHDPTLKGVAVKTDLEIRVSGRAEHFPRRLNDWLRREAKAEIEPRVRRMARALDRKAGRITVRDTKSRWGSCAPNGNLSFCWRLILTPAWVLDYVVAHEVSHLRHMNHSAAFWQTVDSLNVEVDAARNWLNQNAERLQQYG